FHVDSCNPDCASGSYRTYSVLLTAARPETCSVQLEDPTTGSVSHVRAYVYDTIVASPRGAPPPYDPSFTSACS
ncbi:MAG: hypothetical protein ACYDAQ_20550, partial [Mycobacteriales bacterium]